MGSLGERLQQVGCDGLAPGDGCRGHHAVDGFTVREDVGSDLGRSRQAQFRSAEPDLAAGSVVDGRDHDDAGSGVYRESVSTASAAGSRGARWGYGSGGGSPW